MEHGGNYGVHTGQLRLSERGRGWEILTEIQGRLGLPVISREVAVKMMGWGPPPWASGQTDRASAAEEETGECSGIELEIQPHGADGRLGASLA